jgi:hypothetical protein
MAWTWVEVLQPIYLSSIAFHFVDFLLMIPRDTRICTCMLLAYARAHRMDLLPPCQTTTPRPAASRRSWNHSVHPPSAGHGRMLKRASQHLLSLCVTSVILRQAYHHSGVCGVYWPSSVCCTKQLCVGSSLHLCSAMHITIS